MKTILVIGSLLYLLLPFSIWISSHEGFGGDNTITVANAFMYRAINESDGASFLDHPSSSFFELNWFSAGGMYPIGYFTDSTWVLGLIALILGIVSLLAAIIDIHRYQGFLLIIGGVILALARYSYLENWNLSYYEKTEPATGVSIIRIEFPLALFIGLFTGLLSMRDQK